MEVINEGLIYFQRAYNLFFIILRKFKLAKIIC